MTVKLRWPQRSRSETRQIPSAANSVRIVVRTIQGQELVNRLLVRPSVEDVATTEVFQDLPQAVLNVEAAAFPNADGSGTKLAGLQTVATVRANQTTEINLGMDSAIARVAILPETIPFGASPIVVTAAAFDAQNNLILTDRWQWESDNPSVMTLQPNGGTAALHAVGPGSTRIILTETESGVRTERVFNVAPL